MPQVANQPLGRFAGLFSRTQEFGNIVLQIQQSAHCQVLAKNLSHQMDLVQRGQQLIVKPGSHSKALLSPLISNLPRDSEKGSTLLNKDLSRQEDRNHERKKSPISGNQVDDRKKNRSQPKGNVGQQEGNGLSTKNAYDLFTQRGTHCDLSSEKDR